MKKVIEGKKKLYGYRNSNLSIYNQMLDDFEPGMDEEKYDAFFAALKERLVPLIQKVTKAKQLREDFLAQSFPVEEQKKFMEGLLEYLHLIPPGPIKMSPSIPLLPGPVKMTAVPLRSISRTM